MSPARQRLLALGLLAAAVALAWLVVVQPVGDAFAEQSARIDDLRQQLALYQARTALRPVVEMRLAALKQHEASSTGLIGGSSAELAAANMQNIVRAVIQGESGQIHTAQNLDPVTADGFQRVEIQYDASVPMTKLKDVTYRIETSVPYLFLNGIDLRAPEGWQVAGPGPSDPPALEVHWTVHAYRWVGAP